MKSAISAAQCKGARAMLGLSRNKLATLAKVGVRTLVDFERGARQPFDRTLADVQRALEAAGIIFTEEDENAGPGVRLAKRR